MKFLNPLGVLLLLGIPLLIIIYIIKARHEDKAVSSTYLWKLSEKFKKKKRLSSYKSRKILLFALRLLAITVGAFLVCRPFLPNRQNKDYILIVDASASMQTTDNSGTSRFDRALKELSAMSDKVNSGHTVSIILAGDEASYAVKKSTAQNEIDLAIKNLRCKYGSFDLSKALELSKELSETSANPQVYLYTDQSCVAGNDGERVKVIDLSSNSDLENISLQSLSYRTEKNATEFKGKILSTGKGCELTVGLKIDGKTVDAAKVFLEKDTPAEVIFREKITGFKNAELFIEEEDGLLCDNVFALTVPTTRKKNILLVGKSPFYLEKAFSTLEHCNVTVKQELTDEVLHGYDIYIFDGISPELIPEDGSCIFINCTNLPNGISVGEKIEVPGNLIYNRDAVSEVGASSYFAGCAVSEYFPINSNASWETLLSVGGYRVMAVKTYPTGYTHAVISFDLHQSNLPITSHFISFLNELVRFSSPDFLSVTDTEIGKSVGISPPKGCILMTVEDPQKNISRADHKSKVTHYIPDCVGIYTVTGMINKEQAEIASFFAHIPAGETTKGEIESLPVIPFDTMPETRNENATSEITLYLAAALLVLLLIEWGVYYREQY